MLPGVILMCVAIGIRPNNVVFLPMLSIFFRRLYRDGSPPLYVLLVRSFLILIGSILASVYVASILYPDFSISLFLKAYSLYQSVYEYGEAGVD